MPLSRLLKVSLSILAVSIGTSSSGCLDPLATNPDMRYSTCSKCGLSWYFSRTTLSQYEGRGRCNSCGNVWVVYPEHVNSGATRIQPPAYQPDPRATDPTLQFSTCAKCGQSWYFSKASLSETEGRGKCISCGYTWLVSPKLATPEWKKSFNRGVQELNAKNYEDAILSFSEAIQLNADEPYSYFNRGLAYQSKDEIALAIRDFDRAIILNRSVPGLLSARAQSHLQNLDFDSAVRDANEALSLDQPDIGNGYSSWVRGLVAWGAEYDYGLAIRSLDEAIDQGFGVGGYAARGYAHWVVGDAGRAIADLSKAIQLEPEFAWPVNARGWVLLESGQDTRARDDFQTALKLIDEEIAQNPGHIANYATRAWVFLGMGQPEKAIRDADRVLKSNAVKSTVRDAHSARGRSYLKKKEFVRAVADFTRAIELKEHSGETHYYRAEAYWGKREYAQAKTDLAFALAHLPAAFVIAKKARALLGEIEGPSNGPLNCQLPDRRVGEIANSVAVFDFRTTSSDMQTDVGMLLADFCRQSVKESGRYILVDREAMATLLSEEDLASTISCEDTRCMVDFGKKLKAQKIISGRVYQLGETWYVSAKMLDVGSSNTDAIKNAQTQGPADNLTKLIPDLTCDLLRQALSE